MKKPENKNTIKSPKTNLYLIVFLLGCLIGLQPSIYAQASLAAEDIVDDITVTTKQGEERTYTVFRDSQSPEQWFYMPNRIRVAEKKINGELRPKMTIILFQRQNEDELVEGGLLTATFTMGIEPEVIDEVKSQILNGMKDSFLKKHKRKMEISDIKLTSMPLESSTIEFISADGDFTGETSAAMSFSGATSANQEMVISYKLTALGASIFKGLATAPSNGIAMRATVTYKGLTTPCGYSITGNMDNVYSYYEKQTKLEGGFKLGPFKAGASKTTQKVREGLEKIQGIEINEIKCESEGDKSAGDDNFNTLLARVQSEVFDDSFIKTTQNLEELQSLYASTKDPKLKQVLLDKMAGTESSLSVGYQNSVKDIKKRQKGEFNYSYSGQNIVTKTTTFGGELSFSNYGLKSEEELVDEGYVINIDANSDFPSVIIGLPTEMPEDLSSVVLEVSYTNSDDNTHTESAQWSNAEGWVSAKGEQKEFLQFHFIGETNKGRVQEPDFDFSLRVYSDLPNANFKIEKNIKLTQGNRIIEGVKDLTDVIVINAEDLSFRKLTNNDSDLQNAVLTVKTNEMSITKVIKPYYINSNPVLPKTINIMLPKNNLPVTTSLTYKTYKGLKIKRKESIIVGENDLVDSDWKQFDN